MRQAIIYLLLFVTFPSFAQDVEKITAQDTVYIILNNNVHTKTFLLSVQRNEHQYDYKLNEIKDYKKTVFIITYADKKHESNIIVKKKDFLKQNSNAIIDMEFIDAHGLEKVFVDYLQAFSRKKVIYIIDEKCFNKRKFVLRKASVVPIGYATM